MHAEGPHTDHNQANVSWINLATLHGSGWRVDVSSLSCTWNSSVLPGWPERSIKCMMMLTT